MPIHSAIQPHFQPTAATAASEVHMTEILAILLQTAAVAAAIIGFLVVGGWLTDQWFTQCNRIIHYLENRKRSDKK